jgi:hypothetical protein
LWCNNWMDISSYKVSHYGYIEIAISWSWLRILWFNNRIDFLRHKLVTMVIYESLFGTFIFIDLIMSPLRRSVCVGGGDILFFLNYSTSVSSNTSFVSCRTSSSDDPLPSYLVYMY